MKNFKLYLLLSIGVISQLSVQGLMTAATLSPEEESFMARESSEDGGGWEEIESEESSGLKAESPTDSSQVSASKEKSTPTEKTSKLEKRTRGSLPAVEWQETSGSIVRKPGKPAMKFGSWASSVEQVD